MVHTTDFARFDPDEEHRMAKSEHSSGQPNETADTAPTSGSRQRYSVTLSTKSAKAFQWLRDVTDADTDSEVVRNALRLHYVLLQRAVAGDKFMISPKDGGDPMLIDLFHQN
mgnify:CR=1 FL=1